MKVFSQVVPWFVDLKSPSEVPTKKSPLELIAKAPVFIQRPGGFVISFNPLSGGLVEVSLQAEIIMNVDNNKGI